MIGLNAAGKKVLTEADRIQLWEFADAPRKVGGGRGDRLARLVRKLESPGGGTNIWQALAIAAEGSEANDFLLVQPACAQSVDLYSEPRPSLGFSFSRRNFFPSNRGSLRRWPDQIDWEIDPERLRRGDLSSLADDLARQIKRAANTDEIKALAAELGIPGSVVVLALLAEATSKNRAVHRFARTVLKDITAIRIAETLAAFDLA